MMNSSEENRDLNQVLQRRAQLERDRRRQLVCGILLVIVFLILATLAVGMLKRQYDKVKRLEELQAKAISYNGVTYIPNSNIETILFMGIDSKLPLTDNNRIPSEYGQADVIMLAAINHDANEIQVVNIPRDSMVTLALYDVEKNFAADRPGQICLQYAYGSDYEMAEQLMETVITSQLFPGITIDHHVVMDYTVIPTVVDDLGGVNVQMSDTWQIGDVIFGAGDMIPLDGSQCVDFILYRDTAVYGSNFTRISRQKDFLRALMVRMKERMRENPFIISTLYQDLDTHLNTDLSLTDITSLASTVLDADFDVNEDIVILDGETAVGIGFDGEEHDQYYLDEESLYETMVKVFYVPWEE